MRNHSFRGGVHPFPAKDLTKDKPVTEILPTGDLVYPMSQHIGAPARATVAVGDEVLAGQVIGEASGFVSAHVISSVSGKVKAICPRLLPNGEHAEAVILENDRVYRTVESLGTPRDYTRMTAEEIREAVKAAGIVGMGEPGFRLM